MNKAHLISWAALVLAAISFAGFTLPDAGETVDFSKAPAPGLKFKVTVKSTSESSRTMTMDENEPVASKSTVTSEQVYTQAVLKVKDSKIVKLEREYEDHSTRTVREGGRSGRRPRREGRGEAGPQERENPLAWKHIRIEWTEDEAKVTVKEDEEWTEPEGRLKRMIRPERFRSHAIPLPKETKDVGDTWELSEEEAKKFFKPRIRRRGGRGGRGGGGEGEEVDVDIEAEFEFADITDYKERRCAVIKMKVTMSLGEDSTQKTVSSGYFSLKHRIFLGIESKTTAEMKRTMERRERTIAIEMSMEGKSTYAVKILEEEKETDEDR